MPQVPLPGSAGPLLVQRFRGSNHIDTIHQPRPEERASCARLEGRPQARSRQRPSFETRAKRRAPQDEVRRVWIPPIRTDWFHGIGPLAKDSENLNRSALAFLKLASIRLMLRKLCNP